MPYDKTTTEVKQINDRLIGAVIKGTLQTPDKESFGFVCVNPDTGKRFDVWVDRDPEGNGPGHLSIE